MKLTKITILSVGCIALLVLPACNDSSAIQTQPELTQPAAPVFTGKVHEIKMEGTATAFDLPRGSVLAYYPEANVLCGTAVDPRSRTPAFKSVPIWIEGGSGN